MAAILQKVLSHYSHLSYIITSKTLHTITTTTTITTDTTITMTNSINSISQWAGDGLLRFLLRFAFLKQRFSNFNMHMKLMFLCWPQILHFPPAAIWCSCYWYRSHISSIKDLEDSPEPQSFLFQSAASWADQKLQEIIIMNRSRIGEERTSKLEVKFRLLRKRKRFHLLQNSIAQPLAWDHQAV